MLDTVSVDDAKKHERRDVGPISETPVENSREKRNDEEMCENPIINHLRVRADPAVCQQRASADCKERSGTYSAWFGWHSFGTVTDLGKGVMQWHGEFDGALRNDAGSGFMDDASVVCPGATLIVAEHAYYRGNCILTDKDGDRATLVWLCDSKLGDRCDGPMEWVGGTGKYIGIKGNNTFNGGFVGAGPQGYSLFKGEWRLP